MRINALPWLVTLLLALGSSSAARAQDNTSDYLAGDEDGINWFGDGDYRADAGDHWQYDSDLIGDDEWEYDDDNVLTDADATNWGHDNYGIYDSDYSWDTDDTGFDSWYGDSDSAFGSDGFGD